LRECASCASSPGRSSASATWTREEHADVTGPSGTTHQVETLAFWDDREEGDLRVLVAVDDGGWTAFSPLAEGFIIAPDGRFVGE
jgi:hypothetical protein